MTRTVEDAAIMQNHMTGYDKLDVASVDHAKEDYVASMKQSIADIRLGIPRAPFFDMLDEETAKTVEAAIAVLAKMTKNTADCHLPGTAGFSTLALSGEREAYHLELFRRNAQRYSLGVRQSQETAEKALNDISSEPCSEKVVDYVNSNWQIILMRKSMDAAFKNFDLVALPTCVFCREPSTTHSTAKKKSSRENLKSSQTARPSISSDNRRSRFPVASLPADFR